MSPTPATSRPASAAAADRPFSASEDPTPKATGPLVFVHIPKTGGTSLGDFLRRNVGEEGFAHLWEPPEDSELSRLAECRAVIGHFHHGLHRRLGVPCAYATMLRDPVDRVLSHYHYLRHADVPRHELARDHGLEAWLEIEPDARNLQVQYLAGVFGEVGPADLETAKQRLERFAVVGLLEHFEASLALMARCFGFGELSYERKRVNPSRPSLDAEQAVTREIVGRHNVLDLELYRFASGLFEQRLQEVGWSLGPLEALLASLGRRESGVAGEAQRDPEGAAQTVEVPLRIRSSRPLQMRIKPAVDPMVSGWIAQHGSWESYNTVLLQDLLTEGDVFLDVGANLGYFTLVAADRVGPMGRVHAFEPDPENHRFCSENVELNALGDRVEVHRLGLGDRPDEQTLYRSAFNHGGHQLIRQLPEASDTVGVSVPLTSLDQWVAERPEVDRIDCIKMDVQGYETRALHGMREQIARHRDRLMMLVEFSPTLLSPFDDEGVGLEAFFDFLAEEAEAIFGVEHYQPTPDSVGLGAFTLESLRVEVPSLVQSSEEQGMDRCIDLLVLFSPEGVRAFERRIAAAEARRHG